MRITLRCDPARGKQTPKERERERLNLISKVNSVRIVLTGLVRSVR